MGPVVQPEVIAETIYKTALRRRREVWIGWSAVKTILGNMLAPELLDRYLARVGVAGQQTLLPVGPNRRDNLQHPIYDLHRTRGSFGKEAQPSAVVVGGTAGRFVPVASGAALFFVLGCLVGARSAFLRRPNA
jgi:hypothetical protein